VANSKRSVVGIGRSDTAKQKDENSEKRFGIDCKNFQRDARTDEKELERMEIEEMARPKRTQ
jgi:hypothetical protein